MKLVDLEQKHTSIRWTVTTFFLSVSFAIFGISLRVEKSPVPLFVPQLIAIGIYWFTYLLFLRFNDFTEFLRGYMSEMETSNQVDFDLQRKARSFMTSRRRPNARQLLLFFGIICTAISLITTYIYQL